MKYSTALKRIIFLGTILTAALVVIIYIVSIWYLIEHPGGKYEGNSVTAVMLLTLFGIIWGGDTALPFFTRVLNGEFDDKD